MTRLPEPLQDRISSLADGDEDLFARDVQRAYRGCLHSQSRRVWEKLTAEERAQLKREVRREEPLFGEHDSLLEYRCIARISEVLSETKLYSRLLKRFSRPEFATA